VSVSSPVKARLASRCRPITLVILVSANGFGFLEACLQRCQVQRRRFLFRGVRERSRGGLRRVCGGGAFSASRRLRAPLSAACAGGREVPQLRGWRTAAVGRHARWSEGDCWSVGDPDNKWLPFCVHDQGAAAAAITAAPARRFSTGL
jgi:hypothetical protein